MTEYDYMATEPETLTLQAGKRYLNGYGRIIGPLVYHDGWQRYISGFGVYYPSGKIDGVGKSRLQDLVKEYAEPVIATQTPDTKVTVTIQSSSDWETWQDEEGLGFTQSTTKTPDSKIGCKAVQHSDQMYCRDCALAWDMNDPDPPKCDLIEIDDTNYLVKGVPAPRNAFAWHDLISLTATHLLMFGLGFGTAAYFLIGVSQ